MGTRRSRNSYPTPNEALETIRRLGSIAAAAAHYELPRTSFDSWLRREVDSEALAEAMLGPKPPAPPPEDPNEALGQELHKRLRKLPADARVSVYDLADDLDQPPSRIRAALDHLRFKGYRIPEEGGGEPGITLHRVRPDIDERLHRSLLEGTELTVGLVSDTHLGSRHQALPELQLAYDMFEEREITEVWHPGDLVCGLGIYRTQHSEIFVHTYDELVDYAAEAYPKRDGITTRIIAGNHDIEGDIGKVGGDPVAAVAHQRADLDYLGPYSAHIELPGGSYAHLLHPDGGMSYSYSYKAQKLVDGYEAGSKPAILCAGHYHVTGYFLQRNVSVLFSGCFEWRSNYLKRKGLQPSVGFWILNITIGDDGSVVRFVPEWHQFFPGRVSKRNTEVTRYEQAN